MHLSHREKLELADALKQRFLSKEIDDKELMKGLLALRLTLDEIGEIAKEVTRERNDGDGRGGHGLRDVSAHGRQHPSPADQAAYEKSVVWLADYKAARRGGRDGEGQG